MNLLPDIQLPDANSTRGDATVRFVHDDHRQWYVLKSTYGREEKAADILIEAGFYAYVAKRYERYADNGQSGESRLVLKSFIPNVLFAYLTPVEAQRLMDENLRQSSPCPRLQNYADFFYTRPGEETDGTPIPLTVPEQPMHSFILATATCDERLYLLREGTFRVLDESDMLITEGKFRGVVGKRIRAYSQQRVLINLNGLVFIGTPYIPLNFLQKLAS